MNTYTTITYKSKLLRFINPLRTKLFYLLPSNSPVYSLNRVAGIVAVQISLQNSYMLFNTGEKNKKVICHIFLTFLTEI